MDMILSKKEQLDALCRRFRVATLEVFGSAVTDEFDPETSDLDFLVTYLELGPHEHAECYFGLKYGLQELFAREVDLVMLSAVKNPYFLRGIEAYRTALYAAA